jgi:hypothetical protein
MSALHRSLDYRQILIYLITFAILAFIAMVSVLHTDVEAIAVKQDGHILLIREAFWKDRVENCTEVGLQLSCQPYQIAYKN